jgi:integrase
MVMVELKGLHIVRSNGKVYVYAWRGGPRVKAELGSPRFMDAYNAAVEGRRIPDASKFRAQVQLYRGSERFKGLADTTRKVWGRWLDKIAIHFGDLGTAQFDRTQRIKPIIRKWLGTFSDKPRTQDYARQVLSRVLSYCVEQGEIATNPCEGIKSVYDVDRSEIIWTDDDIAQLRTGASAEVMHAVELAAQCGLRTADLFKLAWSHIGEDAIVIRTSKSRFKREAVIPLHDELRAVLKRIPARSTIVLTNSDGHPWKGFSSSFGTAMKRAKMDERDLHFHDLRGTAATKFYLGGISIRTIAEIMGWSEEEVEKIIRRYVSRKAAVQESIRLLRARTGTAGVKSAVKTTDDDEA